MVYIRKPHPKSLEVKPFKTKQKFVKEATSKPNTKVSGKTARYK